MVNPSFSAVRTGSMKKKGLNFDVLKCYPTKTELDIGRKYSGFIYVGDSQTIILLAPLSLAK